MTGPDMGTHSVLRALADADVRHVVVGDGGRGAQEPGGAGAPLRLVVARHPANLAALGTALDRIGASLALAAPGTGPDGPRSLGDPLGSLQVATRHGPLDLLFGGSDGSLYALTYERSEERTVAGVQVRWAAGPAHPGPPPDRSSRAVGRRLLALVDALDETGGRGEGATGHDGPDGVTGVPGRTGPPSGPADAGEERPRRRPPGR